MGGAREKESDEAAANPAQEMTATAHEVTAGGEADDAPAGQRHSAESLAERVGRLEAQMREVVAWRGSAPPRGDASPGHSWPPTARDAEDESGRACLKPCHLEVLKLLDAGLRTRAIARALSLSESRISAILQDGYQLFGVHDRIAFLSEARRRGYLDPRRRDTKPADGNVGW